ncbi:flavin reductase family protein [Nocardiopsis flavescens]|uniref:flavin reductase family protein n=1 Tax=Nocardiopsis flavescens TaxID=758803 RepID=UPI0036526B9E
MSSDRNVRPSAGAGGHVRIEPRILYFGTPVALLSTLNGDGTPNLAPVSSVWALGMTVVLGLGATGQTALNLRERPELVVNLPSEDLWERVERLAPLTGRSPVPRGKPPGCRFEADKFGAAGLTELGSDLVGPPRVGECPLQLEARVRGVRADGSGAHVVVEAEVVRVHAAQDVVVPGTDHVDPGRHSAAPRTADARQRPCRSLPQGAPRRPPPADRLLAPAGARASSRAFESTRRTRLPLRVRCLGRRRGTVGSGAAPPPLRTGPARSRGAG